MYTALAFAIVLILAVAIGVLMDRIDRLDRPEPNET